MTAVPDFTILSIEDDPDHQELLRIAFSECQLAVTIRFCGSAEGAIAELDGLFGDEPDTRRIPHLVLIDVNLPGMSGIELVGNLKSDHRFRLIPAVMLSSSNSARDCTRAYANHANSYLLKPTFLGGLIDMADELVAYWGRRNMPPSVSRG